MVGKQTIRNIIPSHLREDTDKLLKKLNMSYDTEIQIDPNDANVQSAIDSMVNKENSLNIQYVGEEETVAFTVSSSDSIDNLLKEEGGDAEFSCTIKCDTVSNPLHLFYEIEQLREGGDPQSGWEKAMERRFGDLDVAEEILRLLTVGYPESKFRLIEGTWQVLDTPITKDNKG